MMTSAYNTLPSRITAKIGTGSVSELANKEIVEAKWRQTRATGWK